MAVDLQGRIAALPPVMFAAPGRHVTYVPRRSVKRASEGYCGEGKRPPKTL